MARGQWIVKKGMRRNILNLDQVYINEEIIKVIGDINIFLYDVQGVEY